jgi:anti-anti-sigma factor
MPRPYRHIVVDREGEVFCVRFLDRRLDESGIYALADELFSLVTEEGCRKMALCLGPDKPEFMYSVFLAKLVTLRRLLMEREGSLILCEVSPLVLEVFQASKLDSHFRFAPDRKTAVATLGSPIKADKS